MTTHRLGDVDIGALTIEASREHEYVSKIFPTSNHAELLHLSRSIAASNLVIVELLARILDEQQAYHEMVIP